MDRTLHKIVRDIVFIKKKIARLTAREIDPPAIACLCYNTDAQAIPTATWTALEYNTEEYDTSDIHSVSLNPNRLTAPVNGYYDISASVQFSSIPADIPFHVSIVVGGTDYKQTATIVLPVIGNPFVSVSIAGLKLSSGARVRIYVYHSSGVDRSTQAATADRVDKNSACMSLSKPLRV